MEPRSAERGNQLPGNPIPKRDIELQWSHAQLSVEIRLLTAFHPRIELLQWSHAQLSVEIDVNTAQVNFQV